MITGQRKAAGGSGETPQAKQHKTDDWPELEDKGAKEMMQDM